MMDKKSASLFKARILGAMEALSSALTVAQTASNSEEFTEVRTAVGDVIARLDNLLRESVYTDYPELDDLGEGDRKT